MKYYIYTVKGETRQFIASTYSFQAALLKAMKRLEKCVVIYNGETVYEKGGIDESISVAAL